MKKISAGILVYKEDKGKLEILLAHPGGPFWSEKDIGAWSIPKGEINENEDYLDAAKREFYEETGFDISDKKLFELGSVVQKSGKVVYAWGCQADFDTGKFKSNTFETEWPPKSGEKIIIPEIDRVEYFDIKTAAKKINPAQAKFIEKLQKMI